METLKNLETLDVQVEDWVAWVTLNRPDSKNAMNQQMVLDLLAAFETIRNNRDIRAVVLSGSGHTFCAGGDIKEMAAAFQNPELSAQANSAEFDRLLQLVNTMPQVVIAMIEGAAMGGGFGLVCVSDIAVTTETARFALPEVRLGLVPALISPYVIERVGLTRARQLMLMGERFTGDKALEYGLVNYVTHPTAIDDKVQEILAEIQQCSPNAIAACKDLIFMVKDAALDDTVAFRADLLDSIRRTDEAREGMMAFAEKRPAKWVGQ